MCGIAGVVERRGRDPREPLATLVDSLWRRGPDGEGHFVEGPVGLGMRRLSILDIEHGQQPFSTADGAVVAFANGEIYNHREIRRSLGSAVPFATTCDIEVLPHAYRRWGIDGMLRRLDGMFAVAILDRAAGVLHLARDRFGEKPLFYRDDATRFTFASQLTSLGLLDDFGPVDPTALRHYLALHYIPGERTLFREVRRVPPGHRLELPLDGRAGEPRSWLEDAPAGRLPRSYDGGVRRVRQRLTRAVESRLLADVPVGVFLSGGIDSSAIAAAAVRASAAIQTFSIGFEDAELDESVHARAVAEHLGARHHHFELDLDTCLGVFEETMASLDEPLGDPACLPVQLLAREARSHVKVVLSGEGADELFAGYGYYPDVGAARIRRSLSSWLRRRGRPLEPASFFRSDDTTASGFPMLTTREERDRFVPGSGTDTDPWIQRLEERLASERCPMRRAQRADVATWLADDLLPKLDHMTMASSLEGRAPFLEPGIAGMALAAPFEWKLRGGVRKRLLRDAAAPWLPSDILERPKQGFVLPMQRWLAGPLRERLLDELATPHDDGLDHAALRETAAEDLDTGATRSRLLYAVLAYREWWRAVRERRTTAHRACEAAARGAHAGSPDRRITVAAPSPS